MCKKRIQNRVACLIYSVLFLAFSFPVQAVGLDCSSPYGLWITPGSSFVIDYDTTGEASLASSYSCSSWPEAGPEVVYYIYSTAIHGAITAELSNLSADLDVFILNSCNSDNCIAYGDYSASLNMAPPDITMCRWTVTAVTSSGRGGRLLSLFPAHAVPRLN